MCFTEKIPPTLFDSNRTTVTSQYQPGAEHSPVPLQQSHPEIPCSASVPDPYISLEIGSSVSSGSQLQEGLVPATTEFSNNSNKNSDSHLFSTLTFSTEPAESNIMNDITLAISNNTSSVSSNMIHRDHEDDNPISLVNDTSVLITSSKATSNFAAIQNPGTASQSNTNTELVPANQNIVMLGNGNVSLPPSEVLTSSITSSLTASSCAIPSIEPRIEKILSTGSTIIAAAPAEAKLGTSPYPQSLESSLLMQSFDGMHTKSNSSKELSMNHISERVAGSQQNHRKMVPEQLSSSATTPLDMLIAALDPKQPPKSTAAFSTTPIQGSMNECFASTTIWGCPGTDLQHSQPLPPPSLSYSCSGIAMGMDNSTSGPNYMRRASDGGILSTVCHSFGNTSTSSQLSALDSKMLRKGSYVSGIKRQYTDYDDILSISDMYNKRSHSITGDNGTSDRYLHYSPTRSQLQQQQYLASNEPALTQPHSGSVAAFQYSTKRSTSMAPLIESLEPVSGIERNEAGSHGHQYPLASSGPNTFKTNGIPSTIQSSHFVQQQQSFQSPVTYNGYQEYTDTCPVIQQHQHQQAAAMAAAAAEAAVVSYDSIPQCQFGSQNGAAAPSGNGPPTGYFFNSITGNSSNSSVDLAATTGFMMSAGPIPAIPGVTVSPKEKPQRVSVPDLTPTAEEEQAGPKAFPRRQKIRFSNDLYTPMWVRSNGQKKEGFCDTCSPGKWLQLKNSAYWYHKQFFHGISSVSGSPFVMPLQVRHYDADIIEGLCHQCHQWVPIANAKRRNSVLWFRHAHKCHVYHKPKPDIDEEDHEAMNEHSEALRTMVMSPVNTEQ